MATELEAMVILQEENNRCSRRRSRRIHLRNRCCRSLRSEIVDFRLVRRFLRVWLFKENGLRFTLDTKVARYAANCFK